MRDAVDLDRQLELRNVEIEIVVADRVLTAELYPSGLTLEMAP
jgi:hypothetical protein